MYRRFSCRCRVGLVRSTPHRNWQNLTFKVNRGLTDRDLLSKMMNYTKHTVYGVQMYIPSMSYLVDICTCLTGFTNL